MKKIFTTIAMALLAAGSLSAQTMTLTIEGKEVKDGDNVIVHKAVKETVLNPALKMYDLEVEVEFTSLIAQSVRAEGVDLDKTAPGLAVCPTGFTCGDPTKSENNYLTWVDMPSLEANQVVKGEWIHYNYGANKKPADGTIRKSTISFKGASETITFNLTIDTNLTDGINEVTPLKADAPAYNIAGQKVNANAKGIVIKAGKKFIKK